MSDLLTAAAQILGAPEGLVKRSAEARAKAAGLSVDQILSAWVGGAAAVSSQPSAAGPAISDQPSAISQDPGPAISDQPSAVSQATEPSPVPSGVAGQESGVDVPRSTMVMTLEATAQPYLVVEPLPLSERAGLAGKIGAVSGALLGVIGMLIASPWLLPNASLAGAAGAYSPSVLVKTRSFVAGVALLSIAFGLVVAAFSRTLSGWLKPGAALTGRHATTALMGAVVGVVLGLVAGSVLTSAFGVPVEGAEGLVDLPLVSAAIVVLLGGGLLGWVTAALVQVVGVPVGLSETQAEEVQAVKARLAGAVTVPLAGVVSLSLLVVPLGVLFIRSNHMAKGGAAALAILTAVSILAISGLAASRPGMRISKGEFLMAAGGIGLILLIVFAVLLARSGGGHVEEPAAGETTTTVAEA
jgi:MFS family permease